MTRVKADWERFREEVRAHAATIHAGYRSRRMPVGELSARAGRRARDVPLTVLRERWEDEAAAAALEGRPERAGYIERFWLARL